MTRASRLATILDILATHGEVSVEHLVEQLEASPATVRRDLDALAEQHLLTRTHGGATGQSFAYELPIRYKSQLRTDQKRRIAQACSAFISPGSVVGLSGGTTTTAIAGIVAARDDINDVGLTVVTNAVNIATELATRPAIKVVVTGGVIHARSYELVGSFAEQTLAGIRMDMSFIGVNALDAAAGASTHDEREAAVNRIMAQRSHRALIVADSSKIGSFAFATVGDANLFHTIVTDSDIDPTHLSALNDAGYEVIVAS